MAKFHGVIGYGDQTEIRPGVYDDVITEMPYYGDVIRDSRSINAGDKVNSDISVNNSISVVADEYAYENIFAIRYIRWMGVRWIAQEVEVQRPRLIVRLGGVYNGPVPEAGPS